MTTPSYQQVGDQTYYVAENNQQYPIDGAGRPYDPNTQLFLGSPEATSAGLPGYTAVPNTTTNPTSAAATGVSLPNFTATTITNPQLPNGATFTPTLYNTSTSNLQATGQLMNANNPNLNIQPIVPLGTQQGTAAQVDPNAVASTVNPNVGTYTATTIGNNAPQATAQQGTVSNLSTVQGQLAQMYAQSQPGMIPPWAAGAVTMANEQMAARGMGASSIGIAATAAAMQASALPIASQDANTYFQMDLKNLDNRQQTELVNLQARQQSLLSDNAAINAAAQFNASSQSQTQQFLATLMAGIQSQNADRLTAMSQFNAGQTNATAQFNSQLSFARDQFNAQAAFAIEQSNVTWRRSLNTANTAAINAANQVNTQNRFNMSQQAQNQLWQQWRDEASWAYQASENEKNRQLNLAVTANNGTYNGNNVGFNWASAAGAFITGLLV